MAPSPLTPVRSVLVANRGEIARRVFRTCRSLGIATVAVFSDADADAPYVTEADSAVHLPGSSPSDTYLRGDLVVAAALRAGADAVHPGYGFLSENAAFARAVQDAGLVWIGPPPEAIEAMGSKIEAKAMMAEAGVPVLARLDPDAVTEADLPVLVKASAGGGGRGMRVVRTLADLPGEIELASAEAASAFGDPTVFCERYVPSGHHVEVQVMADRHGTVWAVGERECSIQRRHQKVLEEAPSPLVERTPGLRQSLFEASVAAARAIGYEGAGTVEFLADDDGGFWFLETNTRLQVEHPVTECTTGLDLVALQIQVAAGGRLEGAAPASRGHAVEVRIYAEDPAEGYQPQSGTLHRFEVPGVDARFEVPAGAAGIRLDSGVEDGSVVSVHYDAMLAKVIAWAPSRDEALGRLAGTLRRSRIHGITTNRDLLVAIVEHEEVRAGHTDTSFLERHDPATWGEGEAPPAVRTSALAAALALAERNRSSAPVLGGVPSGWRNVVAHPQTKTLRHGDDEIVVQYRHTRDGLDLPGWDPAPGTSPPRLVRAASELVVLDLDGVHQRFEVAHQPGLVWVDSPLGSFEFVRVERHPDPSTLVAPGSLLAPMPGSVVSVSASAGDRVAAGQVLVTLEAMKMQHEICAPAAGTLSELPVAAGDQVDVGAVLAVVVDDDDPDTSA